MRESSREIALCGTFFVGEVSAEVLGQSPYVELDNSVSRLMGVTFKPESYVIGFSLFEEYVTRSLVVVSVQKFLNLLMAGDMDALSLLFSGNRYFQYEIPFHREYTWDIDLVRLADKIVSRRIVPGFAGTVLDYMQKLLTSHTMMVKDSGLSIANFYGYDPVVAFRACYLVLQILELVKVGCINFPLNKPRSVLLGQVLAGELTYSEIKEWIDSLLEDFYNSINSSPLRGEPDIDAIDDWLTRSQMEFWNWRRVKAMPQGLKARLP